MSKVRDKTLHENSGEMPDRQSACFSRKKKRSGDCEYVEWLVSERRSRINTVLIH